MKKRTKVIVSVLRKSTKLKNGKLLQLWADSNQNNVLILKDGNFYAQIGIKNKELNQKMKKSEEETAWIFQDVSIYREKGELIIKFIKDNHVIMESYKNLIIVFNPLIENNYKNGFIVLGKPKTKKIKTRFPMNIGKIAALL